MKGVDQLRGVMKLQAVVFFAYGASFLLIPDFALDTLFGYATDSFWPRALGAAFLGITWLEWIIADRIESNLDLVGPFMLIPGVYVVVFIWERAAGSYPGTDAFWWISFAVSAIFLVVVAATRFGVRPESASEEATEA